MNLFELINYTISSLEIGFASYFFILSSLSLIPIPFSERIRSKDDLDKIMGEEIKRLDLQDENIAPVFNLGFLNSVAVLMPDGTYQIRISKRLANRNFVRHELYHIYKKHNYDNLRINPWLLKKIDYWFRQEPQARVYALLDIKL